MLYRVVYGCGSVSGWLNWIFTMRRVKPDISLLGIDCVGGQGEKGISSRLRRDWGIS